MLVLMLKWQQSNLAKLTSAILLEDCSVQGLGEEGHGRLAREVFDPILK